MAYGTDSEAMAANIIANASNVVNGTNPAYLLTDFYAAYPAYAGRTVNGTTILTATLVSGGTGYSVGNILTIASGTGGIVRVDSVDTNGVILTTELITGGTGYTAGTGIATTVIPTGGTGATFTTTVNTVTTYLVDPSILQMYIDFADACIKETRWHSSWKIAMGWFIAHFITLYLQSMANPTGTAAQAIAAGQARGLLSSKGVGDVSASYDFNSIANDLDGWAAWKLTVYGQQLATMGKRLGHGGMYIW